MFAPRDLRERVALFFAGFGALLSMVLALVVYQAVHDQGRRLIDETLAAELDDYIARRERNPNSLPPSTVVLQGYVSEGGRTGEVPGYLADLPLGWHDVVIGKLSYRVAVIERKNTRFFMLHDASLQMKREQRFMWLLGAIVLAATLLSALGGYGLSRATVAPLADLAARVRHRGVEDDDRPLADDFPEGEIGELARVFDRHMLRMRAFIERERAFNADMSHELRTSLAVILSTTEILLDDPQLTPKQKERIARIDRAARDMADLSTALLLMAREEGMLGDTGGCAIAAVIERAVERHRYMLAGKPVEVDLQLDNTVELSADPALADILIGNLIRNAFAYTMQGRVSIRQDRSGFSVADTGRGMSEQAASQAFVRHFRDIASQGAGIGLSLVKRICDQYDWQVHLESRAGCGTTVSVKFT